MGDGPTYQEINRAEVEVRAPQLTEDDQAKLHAMWFGSPLDDETKLARMWDAINRLLEARHHMNLNRIVWIADEGFLEPEWVQSIKQDGGHFIAICVDCARDFIPTKDAFFGLNFAGAPLYQHWGYESEQGWRTCHRPSILQTFWAARSEANIENLERWHPSYIHNRHTGVWRKVEPSDG